MNETPLFCLSNNVKTVNSVFVSEQENRLITGSVDCHVKVYDMEEVCSIELVQSGPSTEVAKTYHMPDFYSGFEPLLRGHG